MSIKILLACSRNLSNSRDHKNVTGSQHGWTKSTINHVSNELHIILIHKHATGCTDAKTAAPAYGEILNEDINSSIHVHFNSNHYVTTLRLTHKAKQHSDSTTQGDEL